MLKEMTVGVS